MTDHSPRSLAHAVTKANAPSAKPRKRFRILVTGFGPFPGVPVNPTARLVASVQASRRIMRSGLEITGFVLPTTWMTLDQFDPMIEEHRPDLIIMFGLAGHRRIVTPERFGRNTATPLKPDADGRRKPGRALDVTGGAVRRAGLDPHRIAVAIGRAGVAAAPSRTAGDYLCNALAYRAYGGPTPALFIHIPRPRTTERPRYQSGTAPARPTLSALQRAAVTAVLAATTLARRGLASR
jgi:pyroglutamyl-peptidase